MKLLIALVVLGLFSVPVSARDFKLGQDWVLVDAPIEYRENLAGLCSNTFLLTISQPKDKIDCSGLMDTLFLADLCLRKVFWSRKALSSVAPQERQLDLENLYVQLKSGSLETLENMRNFYLAGMDQSQGMCNGYIDAEISPRSSHASNKPKRISPYIQPR